MKFNGLAGYCAVAVVVLLSGCADRRSFSRQEFYRGAALESDDGYLRVVDGQGDILALTRGTTSGRWSTAHGQWDTILLVLPAGETLREGLSHTFDRNLVGYRGYSRISGWDIMPEAELEIRLEVLEVEEDRVVARVSGSVPLRAYRLEEEQVERDSREWLPRYNCLRFRGRYRFVRRDPERM